MSKRKPLTRAQGEQAVKIAAVLLRDHTPLTFEDVIRAFVYCWCHTESVEAAERRESK